MKNLIKLLVLAGTLLSVGALAANKTTTFNFIYPEYFYFTTNLASETFDFATNNVGSNHGQAATVATKNALDTCLDHFLANNSPSVTANDSAAGSSTISASNTSQCEFAATDTSQNNAFSVSWGSTGETAEGAVLVATNKSSWAVAAKISSDFSQVSSYVDLQLKTSSGGTFTTLSSTATNVGSVQTGSNPLNNAYYTDYMNIYVVPLQYKLVLTNPIAIPEISSSSPDTATVTYESASP